MRWVLLAPCCLGMRNRWNGLIDSSRIWGYGWGCGWGWALLAVQPAAGIGFRIGGETCWMLFIPGAALGILLSTERLE